MAWIVEAYIRMLPNIKEKGDIHSDEFNNAILIEKCITDLYNKNLITELEREIIDGIYLGYNYSELSLILNRDRQTISKIFGDVTDRIAFILGGEFSNSAFVERIESLGDLTEHGVEGLFKRGTIRHDTYHTEEN
jgi:hypothetical protein